MTHLVADGSEQNIIERLLAICHINDYPPRTTVVVPGDAAESLYYVVEGSLSVTMSGDDDRDYILGYLHPGDFIGEMGLFIPPQARQVHIITRSQCRLAKVSYQQFWHALDREMKDIALDVVGLIGKKLSMRLLRSNQRVVSLSSMDAQGRVARTLLELCREPGAMVEKEGTRLRITRDELGRLAGCSREVVSRMLKVLEERQVIAMEGRDIIVLNTDKACA